MATEYGIINNARGFPNMEAHVREMISTRSHIIKAVKGNVTVSDVNNAGRVIVSLIVEHTVLKGDQKLQVQMNPDTGWVYNLMVDSE